MKHDARHFSRSKRVVILDPSSSAPLLPLDYKQPRGLASALPNSFPYSHLFKEVDVPKISRVHNVLKERGLESYLAGSVITYPLFKGPKFDYNDIDLVVVGSKTAVDELKADLQRTGQDSIFDYSTNVTLEGEVIPYRVKFGVSSNTSSAGGYVPVSLPSHILDNRYTVKVSDPATTRTRPIDLILFSQSQFRRTGFIV